MSLEDKYPELLSVKIDGMYKGKFPVYVIHEVDIKREIGRWHRLSYVISDGMVLREVIF